MDSLPAELPGNSAKYCIIKRSHSGLPDICRSYTQIKVLNSTFLALPPAALFVLQQLCSSDHFPTLEAMTISHGLEQGSARAWSARTNRSSTTWPESAWRSSWASLTWQDTSCPFLWTTGQILVRDPGLSSSGPWLPLLPHLTLLLHICVCVCVCVCVCEPYGDPVVKNLFANAGAEGLIPGLERSPGEGNGNPLQYSCLGNPIDGGPWWATVHGVTKSWAWLSN